MASLLYHIRKPGVATLQGDHPENHSAQREIQKLKLHVNSLKKKNPSSQGSLSSFLLQSCHPYAVGIFQRLELSLCYGLGVIT